MLHATPFFDVPVFDITTLYRNNFGKRQLRQFSLTILYLQAALVIRGFAIRGFAIRGFDYSRTRKPGKTANNKGKAPF